MYFKNNRITLVALDLKHLDQVINWINNEEISESSTSRFPVGIEQQKEWILKTVKNKSKQKLIIQNEKLENVGMVSIMNIDMRNSNAEVGVYIDPMFMRKGYAVEALKMVIDFAFKELNLFKLYANIHQDNMKSISLFEKLNFKFESKFIKEIYKKGEYTDLIRYYILNN